MAFIKYTQISYTPTMAIPLHLSVKLTYIKSNKLYIKMFVSKISKHYLIADSLNFFERWEEITFRGVQKWI